MRAGRAVVRALTCAWIFGGALGMGLGAGFKGDGLPTGMVEGQLDPPPMMGEVLFISEERVTPFLESTLTRVRAELEQAQARRAELRTRMEQSALESSQAEDAVRKAGPEILQRRLEVLRRSATVGQLAAARRKLTAQSVALKQRAHELRQQAAAARQEYERADQALARIADGSSLISELPKPLLIANAGPDGRFLVNLSPGRYAVAATTRDSDGISRAWFAWATVKAGGVSSLQLDSTNLAGSGCPTCVLDLVEPVCEPGRITSLSNSGAVVNGY